jgi:hypothetical protein
METCEVCGNTYDKPIHVEKAGQQHVFDCFACAIQLLAPRCATCGTIMIGHGMEADGDFYCCAHCARGAGQHALADRV